MSIFTRDKDPLVLVLKGVSLSELVSIDKLWGSDDSPDTEKRKPKYCKLPEEFFGLDTWVLKSNLRCCRCRLKYNTIPISMPIRVVRNDTGQIGFKVKYNYCSFPCCMKAIASITDTSLREYRMEMLKIMFKYFFNIDLGTKTIDGSPDTDNLEEYGGDLTQADFRKKINKITSRLVVDTSLETRHYILDLDHNDDE